MSRALKPLVQVAPIGEFWVYRLIYPGVSIKSEGFPFGTRAEAVDAAAARITIIEHQRADEDRIYKWEPVDRNP